VNLEETVGDLELGSGTGAEAEVGSDQGSRGEEREG
jgi:hypothetical protein